jgi:hypothetical protein
MVSKRKPAGRVSLTLLALISFVISFAIARTFTTIRRGIVLRVAGFHIHHFWYGTILVAIGLWLAIRYKEERIARPAVVLIGSGGGLIGDEVGLLLTGNYWTGITYTIVVFFIAFISAVLLFKKYSGAISAEIRGFTKSRASFYFGIILATVSIAFLTTRNFLIAHISIVTTVAACIILIAYLVQRIRRRQN